MSVISKIYFKLKHIINNYSSTIKLFMIYSHAKHRFNYGKNLKFLGAFNISFDASKSKIIFKDDITFRRYISIVSGNNSNLIIGSHNFFNNGCSVNCLHKIIIGDNCQFGENVKIYDHNHKYDNKSLLINQQGFTYGEIIIGNNCWIGSNVTILKNVCIGNNVIIGAGVTVHKSIKDNVVLYSSQNLVLSEIY
jgi:acetyltransferase-like isoleucine patch superfamily enzyme